MEIVNSILTPMCLNESRYHAELTPSLLPILPYPKTISVTSVILAKKNVGDLFMLWMPMNENNVIDGDYHRTCLSNLLLIDASLELQGRRRIIAFNDALRLAITMIDSTLNITCLAQDGIFVYCYGFNCFDFVLEIMDHISDALYWNTDNSALENYLVGGFLNEGFYHLTRPHWYLPQAILGYARNGKSETINVESRSPCSHSTERLN